jgi:DNA-binding LacI/PurR family transcriptional regulator
MVERRAGCAAALREAGLEDPLTLEVPVGDTHLLTWSAPAQQAVAAWLAPPLACDALFAGTDVLAYGALAALDEAGLRVPEQVAVVGFDDLGESAHVSIRPSPPCSRRRRPRARPRCVCY